jgi:hypothetical protein
VIEDANFNIGSIFFFGLNILCEGKFYNLLD